MCFLDSVFNTITILWGAHQLWLISQNNPGLSVMSDLSESAPLAVAHLYRVGGLYERGLSNDRCQVRKSRCLGSLNLCLALQKTFDIVNAYSLVASYSLIYRSDLAPTYFPADPMKSSSRPFWVTCLKSLSKHPFSLELTLAHASDNAWQSTIPLRLCFLSL